MLFLIVFEKKNVVISDQEIESEGGREREREETGGGGEIKAGKKKES